jgi:A/G-specific adenine glycosylase
MANKSVRGAAPDIGRLRRSLKAWYRRAARDLPWRRTGDPYSVWVSEVMLQQTTVAAVVPYYERFLKAFPDIASLARAQEETLLGLWSGLGYYRRARNLLAAARLIVERHAGRFPRHLDEIESLPGIGRYTAGAIASICFGLPTPAVDGNVARVLKRIYAIDGDGDRQVWDVAQRLVPRVGPGDWTQALMELGATLCRPVSPECGICPVSRECLAFTRGATARYGAPRTRPAQRRARAAVAILTRNGRVLFVRRDGAELLGGLWELPGTLPQALGLRPVGDAFAVSEGADERLAASLRLAEHLRESLDFPLGRLSWAGTVRHSVTKTQLSIDAWVGAAPRLLGARFAPLRGDAHIWAHPEELASLPIGAASRKALSTASLFREPMPATPRPPRKAPEARACAATSGEGSSWRGAPCATPSDTTVSGRRRAPLTRPCCSCFRCWCSSSHRSSRRAGSRSSWLR